MVSWSALVAMDPRPPDTGDGWEVADNHVIMVCIIAKDPRLLSMGRGGGWWLVIIVSWSA